ncbi:hypothetical protein BGP78_06240 [Pseudoalteromonas sp. MSK9-3]|uniref:methyltransferase family protein n=1 Tax=Pseudoalteromonas sp. MSK9-3 TaxID=1897633 RepID=UPI000E6D3AD6|nr:isoprenylcysteine carboxylmethyltransferase family protein [Pseudoalteromonas sp. MSK9-3]RJE78107.1 hypothetical protein BGP78_06240 [Pseudoalteromonas sp. MSK9-3]
MKKILPPILFLVCVVLMVSLCWSLKIEHNLSYPITLIGIPFIISGLLLCVISKSVFKRENTNIMTFGMPNKLVTSGPFQYSRNPMYLGFSIALFGFVLAIGASFLAFVFLLIFVAVSHAWYIRFEEQKMKQAFGKDYLFYCNKVRRWF